MPLDPQAAEFLREVNLIPQPPPSEWTPDEGRRQMLASSKVLGEPEPVAGIEDRPVPGPAGEIQVRIYRPRLGAERLAGVVYFHGGGWVHGGLETHDHFCRSLANAADAVAVAVDYRLAPEHPFPAAVDDALAACTWVAENAALLGIDADRISTAGDSAGGNLATVCCLLARDRGGPRIASQALIYPITDCDFETGSYHEFAEGHYLTRAAMQWFFEQYAPDESARSDPRLCPIQADDLSRLPPALVVTAECDPLRDEGELYARRLSESGADSRLIRYDGMIHGFVRRQNRFDKARAALADIAAFLTVAASD